MSSSSAVAVLYNIVVSSTLSVDNPQRTSATRSSRSDGCNRIGKAFYLQVYGLVQCEDGDSGSTFLLQISKEDGDHSTGGYWRPFTLDTALTVDLELSRELYDKLDDECHTIRSYNTPIVPVNLTPEQIAQRAANEAVAKLCQQKAEEEEQKRMEERLKKEFSTVPGLRA